MCATTSGAVWFSAAIAGMITLEALPATLIFFEYGPTLVAVGYRPAEGRVVIFSATENAGRRLT